MSDIVFSREGKIAIIKLNRPEVMNAFTIDMIDQWAAALKEYKDDDAVHAVILTGEGERAFCAGIDLKEMENTLDDGPLERKHLLWDHIHPIALTLEQMDKPMICAVNGLAVGAGMDMALMCDIRFASEKAKLSEGYIKVGIIPGDGGAYFLPRLTGIAKALELLWTGDFISAEQAREFGIVSEVYQPGELFNKTMEFAERVISQPTVAVRMIKRAVYQSARLDLRTHLDLISSHFSIVRGMKEHRQALETMKNRKK